MDRLNQVASYFNERERKKLDQKIKDSSFGVPEMTVDEIRLSCMENNGYETPDLNDKLYLHFRGFRKIENLDSYTGCKSLWLDSNGFSRIENLSPLVNLRCLYLSKNLITKIEGIESLTNLTILDLANNRITHVENLSNCLNLQTINLSHNYLASAEAIEHFKECPALNNIDITNNRLPEDEAILENIKLIPSLVALSINGNDVTKISSFRKKYIHNLSKLCYLDRPIDEQERLFASAFLTRGKDAEAAARQQWKEDQAAKRVKEMEDFKTWQKEQKELRKQAKLEGRSLITEMTPEEIQQRQAEANAAHEAEQRILNIGIDKLATKYWKMQDSDDKNPDLLDAAATALLEEQEVSKNETRVVEIVETTEPKKTSADVSSVIEEEAMTPDGTAARPLDSEAHVEDINITLIEETTEKAQHETHPAESVTPVVFEQAETVDVTSQYPAEEVKSGEAAVDLTEEQEQLVREQRVQESLAIYKRQLQQQNQRTTSHSSTWDAPFSNQSERVELLTEDSGKIPNGPEDPNKNVEERPLYWSETMDIELGKMVKICVFDFDDISSRMRGLATDGKLGYKAVHEKPSLITSDACRLRWSQLDAQVWAEVSPGVSALDTLFKVCINSNVLGAGHGAQPQFDALASIAAGEMPTYLTVPTSFPSVRDLDDEDGMELLD